MPIYEYRCEKGHTFEVLQKMSDPPITVCEIDGGPVERVLHAPAVHFKGSGFYSTDYGSKKRAREMKDAGEGKGSSNGTGEPSSSSGSDSKTESKSDSKPEKAASTAKSDSK